MEIGKWDNLLDQAILNEKIKPIILVLPNQHTQYQGSWYANSDLTKAFGLILPRKSW